MLLDCSKLTHWQWEREIDELFTGQLKLGPWLWLLDESPERIGLIEEEWNHHDTLTEKTKLLHNTEARTQPWKTGLPADYHQYAPEVPVWLEALKRIARRMVSLGQDRTVRYQPHPDPAPRTIVLRVAEGVPGTGQHHAPIFSASHSQELSPQGCVRPPLGTAQLLLVLDVRQYLIRVVTHGEAGVVLLDRPGRRKAAGIGQLRRSTFTTLSG